MLKAIEKESASSTIRRAVITAVSTAVVGGVIGWIGGWLPALWEGIAAASVWAWSLLTLSVPVPLAILAILVLPFVIRFVRAARWIFTKQETPANPAAPAEPELSELELGLLRLLARGDGAHVHFDDAAVHLATPRLVLQKMCEGLTMRGYIEPENDRVWGTHIVLTRRGRDFVIEHGFVQ